jgi:hypothetical protein
MADSCNLLIKISRADFHEYKLADKGFSMDADHGTIVEASHCGARDGGREQRDHLEGKGIIFLGSRDTAADYGCAVFASDGERSGEFETDRDGTYLVPADSDGVINAESLAWLREFIPFRKSVAAKMGLCSCCELPSPKCRLSGR